MDGRQIQAARALLGWSQMNLADAAQVSIPTVKRAEGSAKARASLVAIEAMRTALEDAGIEFIPENGGGAGVRLNKMAKK